MKRSWRFAVLLGLILLGGILVNTWAYLGEAKVTRKELKEFPSQIGAWRQTGVDQQFDTPTLEVLRASDYLMRDYRAASGPVANFYVGYYATQREGASYHSPLNCLPGGGWTMSNPGSIWISPKGRPSFEANKYLIENGGQKNLLVYWYQGRGRAVASEYWGKIYTVLDSVRRRRSDGAMVRVTIPVGESETAALQAAADLAARASVALPEFIPD
jgi:EpsI family protein